MSRRSTGGSRSRDARNGQYVSKETAARRPRTTVTEATGGRGGASDSSRSSITGRYVKAATADRHPSTTVTERGRK